MSLPSPGSQTNVSLPLPNSPTSLPPLPSIESLPLPPTSVSAPEPPARVSFPLPPSSVTAPAPPTRLSSPFPPSIVVGIVSVKRPLLSSMRTTSSPFPPLTEIFPISARANLKSAEPSSPTSTCRIAGLPLCSRSASRSPALVPSIASSPCASCGSLNAASFRSCDALWAWWAGGVPYPAAVPAVPPTAAIAATAETANSAGRTARESWSRMKFLMASFPEWNDLSSGERHRRSASIPAGELLGRHRARVPGPGGGECEALARPKHEIGDVLGRALPPGGDHDLVGREGRSMHPRLPAGDRRRRHDPRRAPRLAAALRRRRPAARPLDGGRDLRPTASAGARSSMPAQRRGPLRAPDPRERQDRWRRRARSSGGRRSRKPGTSPSWASRAGRSMLPRCRPSSGPRTTRSETA